MDETAYDRVRKYVDYRYNHDDVSVVNSDLVDISSGDLRWLVDELEVQWAIIRELDMQICCDGRDCGCQGSSKAQQAEHYIREDRLALKEGS